MVLYPELLELGLVPGSDAVLGDHADYIIIELSLLKEMSSKTNYKVYMDIQIGATAAGRIIFEIFNDLTPKTS